MHRWFSLFPALAVPPTSGAPGHAGTLTSANWFQVTEVRAPLPDASIPMTRTSAQLGASGIATDTSIRHWVTVDFYAWSRKLYVFANAALPWRSGAQKAGVSPTSSQSRFVFVSRVTIPRSMRVANAAPAAPSAVMRTRKAKRRRVITFPSFASQGCSGGWMPRSGTLACEHPEHAERFLARAMRLRRRLWEARA